MDSPFSPDSRQSRANSISRGPGENSDSPSDLTSISGELPRVLGKNGKGRLMINCGGLFEVCFFRPGMWKLMGLGMPEDPFEGPHVDDQHLPLQQ